MGLKIGKKYNRNYSPDEIVNFIENDIQEAIKKREIIPFKYIIEKKKLGWTPEITVKVLSISKKPFVTFKKGKMTKEFAKFKNKLNEIGNAYNKIDSDRKIGWFQIDYYFEIKLSDKFLNEINR
jgi:hypothetical protein